MCECERRTYNGDEEPESVRAKVREKTKQNNESVSDALRSMVI